MFMAPQTSALPWDFWRKSRSRPGKEAQRWLDDAAGVGRSKQRSGGVRVSWSGVAEVAWRKQSVLGAPERRRSLSKRSHLIAVTCFRHETPAALSCRLWRLERTKSTVCSLDNHFAAPTAQQWIRSKPMLLELRLWKTAQGQFPVKWLKFKSQCFSLCTGHFEGSRRMGGTLVKCLHRDMFSLKYEKRYFCSFFWKGCLNYNLWNHRTWIYPWLCHQERKESDPVSRAGG